jgi:RNA polymerase sigma-70 factor (ECF subfamily)
VTSEEKKLINNLVIAVGKSDEQSLILLYQAISGRLLSIAKGLLKNHQDAEDAVSEAFVRIVKYAPSYKKSNNAYGWAATILRNCAIDILKNKQIDTNIDDAYGLAAESEDIDTKIDIRAALFKLEEQEREILLLRYYGDLTVRDIAKKLNLPKSTVMNKLQQAEKKLLRLL